ncbi:helix-turn-helix transcriptional regulator [Brevibacillus laterosporus]|uniref:helix-turn-helix domain-containing protein n=1 Tax=Brevibacillus laterosporus TaxID=1465 RepID=UPI00036A6FB5|nr:helix-turn-helix transcriptional regulator [Brevibacillus laterosporus]ATO50170.1 transcriptional regulator [Brevibacillus laterosporus DSM 25]MBG9801488.1 DNA-binding protein [Brevibacillus laterosporus]MED2005597.1 helix-turn-helix transcriptional regulator [Brevibacillus laterosporus]MED4762833.1 helix-turn-helix transcriptional regulator [Brevibacillus laterosporus]TPH14391.1 XRE family transcriptional regulator [Brevibacillus laterosporus]
MQVLEYNYQVAQIELRQRLQDTLDKKGWKQKDLVLATEIDSVTISQILNNKQKITLSQLVAVTKALDLQEDTFYEEFLGDCFNESGKMSPIKTAEFFISCIKAERYDITKKIMALINEDTDRKRLLDNTFKMAEYIFSSDKRNYSLPLYDIVIANSTTRNERVAICYFKRFVIARDVDLTVSGYKMLHQLLEYLPLLPKEYKLEAYYKILTFYNAVEKWGELLKYAAELKELAITFNDSKFIAEALLYESFSYREMKDYDKALLITKEYANYEGYQQISKLNELLFSIEMGYVEYVDNFASLATDVEIFMLLPVAIETYLQKKDIESIQKLICTFEEQIKKIACQTSIPTKRHKLKLYQALASYYFIIENSNKGFAYIFEALELAIMFKNVERVRSIILKYYEYDYLATPEQKEKFVDVMTERDGDLHEARNNFLTSDSFLVRLYRNEF